MYTQDKCIHSVLRAYVCMVEVSTVCLGHTQG